MVKHLLALGITGSVLLIVGMIINIVTSTSVKDSEKARSLQASAALIGIGWLLLIGVLLWIYIEYLDPAKTIKHLQELGKLIAPLKED